MIAVRGNLLSLFAKLSAKDRRQNIFLSAFICFLIVHFYDNLHCTGTDAFNPTHVMWSWKFLCIFQDFRYRWSQHYTSLDFVLISRNPNMMSVPISDGQITLKVEKTISSCWEIIDLKYTSIRTQMIIFVTVRVRSVCFSGKIDAKIFKSRPMSCSCYIYHERSSASCIKLNVV